jgi:hypothetical protein
MNSLLRGLMASDGNTNRPFPSLILLGIVDFCCILIRLEQINVGKIASGAIWIGAGIGSGLIGYYWPQIKQTIANVRAWFRKEPSNLVIEVQKLQKELSHWQAKYSAEKATDLSEKANAENQVLELERKVAGLRSQIKPLREHPIPDLRLRILETCTELQAFLGSHGEKVRMDMLPEEDHDAFMSRVNTPERQQARIKFVGDYRRRYRQSVSDLRDEIRQRCAINDEALNTAISFAENGAGAANAVEQAIKRFWDIARDVNV